MESCGFSSIGAPPRVLIIRSIPGALPVIAKIMADTTSLVQQAPLLPSTGMMDGLRRMPVQRMFSFLLAAAVLISLLVGVMLWSRSSDYKVLYANISDRDGGAVVQALTQMNVPYKFSEGGGVIYVPSDKVHEVRLRLASQGLPRGGNVGFELMENQKFGTTQFQEQVNYQRALEGELARSIQSLSAVQDARVHLAIPKPSVFLREQQKPSASVLLNLYPGRSLQRDQVAGIAHLVSSSVPDLPIAAVSILDQNGTLLSNDGSAKEGTQLDAQQLAYMHQVEASYIKRIVDILEPVVGRNNVRAQVTADLDFSESEATAEIFKPNQNPSDATIRSQQTTESLNGSPSAAGGVPGALTNQPVPAATAPIGAAAAAVPATAPGAANGIVPAAGTAARSAANTQTNLNTHKESTTNYEVDKTVRHTRTPTGSIRRLSAAVVVNYRRQAAPADAKAKDAKTAGASQAAASKLVALTPEDMEKINALVKEAMGYTEERGDSLNIANVAFNQPEVIAPEEVPMWKQPENIEMAKELGKSLMIAALVLVILLTIVKPLLKSARTPASVQPLPIRDNEQLQAPAQNTGYEQRLESTRQLARSDPKVVASVVRDWVSKDE
jgi:flagellar M-ring protein FliF